MDFSTFANIIYPYIGEGQEYPEFVLKLTDLVMEEPRSEEDKAKSKSDTYNPLAELQSGTRSKIYSGNRSISKKNAGILLSHFDKTKFIDAIYGLSDDAKDGLVQELTEYGMVVSAANVDEACADLFQKLIDALAHGQNTVVVSPETTVDAKGNKIETVPLSTAYCKDGKLYIGSEEIRLPIQLIPEDEIAPHEFPYINALCAAYADELGRAVVSQTEINSLPGRYREHYSDQRKAYFSAESIQRSLQEIYDDGKNQFDILKEDAYEGIKDTYWGNFTSGYERLRAVLIKITSTTLDKSTLAHIENLIGNLEKKGICHILVNDDKIKSWVNIDG